MLIGVGSAALLAQRPDAFPATLDHPAIEYFTRPAEDPIARLNAALRLGAAHLAFEPASGYLLALLAAVQVPIESQLLVFSEASAQAAQINLRNPRALYFNDEVAVGWVRGSKVIEVAALDPRQGVMFYTLEQKPASRPQFARDNSCLECHRSWDSYAVPGLQTLSTFPMADDKNAYASGLVSDHRTAMNQRWGGWYVTGKSVPARHLGNLPVVRPSDQGASTVAPALTSLDGRFDLTGYPSTYSDVAALMVLEHQTRMTNLITWVGWESRIAASAARVPRVAGSKADGVPAVDRVTYAARELVDYLLFVDEAPLPRRVEGSSGFTEWFSARGPVDRKGRSLRQLDLTQRLLRYPCSYMIESGAFDALPTVAKEAVYRRLWDVLSGRDATAAYGRLSRDDRQAIVEILRETKRDLPDYFQPVTR